MSGDTRDTLPAWHRAGAWIWEGGWVQRGLRGFGLPTPCSTATASPSPDKAAAPALPAASHMQLSSAQLSQRTKPLRLAAPAGSPRTPWRGWSGGTRVSLLTLALPQASQGGAIPQTLKAPLETPSFPPPWVGGPQCCDSVTTATAAPCLVQGPQGLPKVMEKVEEGQGGPPRCTPMASMAAPPHTPGTPWHVEATSTTRRQNLPGAPSADHGLCTSKHRAWPQNHDPNTACSHGTTTQTPCAATAPHVALAPVPRFQWVLSWVQRGAGPPSQSHPGATSRQPDPISGDTDVPQRLDPLSHAPLHNLTPLLSPSTPNPH